MKNILILILLVVFVACSDGNKKEDLSDNDNITSDLSADEDVADAIGKVDESVDETIDESADESTDEVEDEATDEITDEVADEVADEVTDEVADSDFIPECVDPEDCGTHENECKDYDCTAGKCAEKDLDEKVCDDLNACTVDDKCSAGVCGGIDKDCSQLDTLCGTGVCNSANGNCYFDEKEEGATCDDGDDCTAQDKCQSGTCSGVDYACFNSGACLEDDYLCSCSAGFDPDLYCYECLGNYSVSSSCADCADGFGGETCNCSISGYGGHVNGFWIEDGTMNIFSVGSNGTIYRYTSEAKWVVQKSNTTMDLNSIFGFSETDIYAGGDNVLFHWNGTSWKKLNDVFSSSDYSLGSLWGSGPTDLWAADNYSQKIYHYDGTSWSEKTSDRFLQFVIEVWGTSSDSVYVVSYGSDAVKGRVIHWNGTEWSTVLETDKPIYEITGTDDNNIYVAGSQTVWHFDGTSWSEMAGAPLQIYTDAHFSGTKLYLSTYSGKLVVWDGIDWNEYDSGLEKLFSVKKGKFRVYMGGLRNGIVSSATLPNMLVSVPDYSSSFLINDIAMTADGSEGYAVGTSGKIFHYIDGAWIPEESGTTNNLYSVTINNTTVYAAGNSGTLVKRMNDDWSVLSVDSDYAAMNFRGVYIWAQNEGGTRFLLAGYDPNDSDKGFVTVSTFLTNLIDVNLSYDPGKITKISAYKDSETVTVMIGSEEGKVSYYHSTDTTSTNDSITQIDNSAGAVTSVYVFNKFKSYVGKADAKILECGDSICSEMTVNTSATTASFKGIYKEIAVDSEGRIFVLESNEWSEQIPKIGTAVTISSATGSEAGIFMGKFNAFLNFYSCE